MTTSSKQLSSDESIALIRSLYAAINSFDLKKLRSLMHPEMVRDEFLGTPRASTFRDLEQFMAMTEQARSTWAEGACTPQDFEFHGARVVVPVHVRVKMKATGEWVEGPVIDGFAFRDGLISEFHSFNDRAEALAWAKLK